MKKNIKILLIAAMAVMSGNVWATDETTYPAGIYYFEFVGFNSTSDEKVFGFNMFNNLTNYHSQSGDVVQLYSEGTCNTNVKRTNYNFFENKTSSVPMDVVAINLSSTVSIQSDNACLKLGVGETTYSKWDDYNWKNYSDVGTPIAFTTGVYYMKITRTGYKSYTAVWQTSGSLPDCANPGHALTFTKSGGGTRVDCTVESVSKSSGVYVEEGDRVVLTAVENSDAFTCWKDGSGNIVSYDNPYSFDMPNEAVSLTAYFAEDASIGGCANCFKYLK